jgi:hypothetical protein
MSQGTARIGGVWRALLVCLAMGCGQKIQEQYEVQIIGPTDTNYLTGVRTVVLEVGGKEVSRTTVKEGQAFNLTGTGIDTNTTTSGAVRVRGLGENGELLAYGQTPEMELLLASPPRVQVFVQKPGSFGRALSLPNGRKNLIAVAAVAGVGGLLRVPMVVVLFGLGDVTLVDSMTMAVSETPSEVLGIYNPLVHDFDDADVTGMTNGLRQPRDEAAAIARPDGQILIFGGRASPALPSMPLMSPRPSAQLDLVRVQRADFDLFVRGASSVRDSDTAGIARVRPAMADADVTYAFGGLGMGDAPLDTVVAINPADATALRLLTVKMAGPRDGLTATSVTVSGVPEIFIFGGGADTTPVAEVFTPGAAPKLEVRAPTTGAIAQRRDHGAVLLPGNETVLIVGGRDNAGAALGTSVLFNARTNTLVPGPLNLKTPRSKFAMFIVDKDLVIAAGFDAQNAPIGNAEVFDASSEMLTPKGVVPCVPRGGPVSATLQNQSAVMIGGQQANGQGSAVVEIYQPFRTTP